MTDGVGIFVAEKWVGSVVSVERHSERVLVLKMVLDDCLLNVYTVYAPHSGKPDGEKERFWNEVFHLVSCIPQNEMVVFAGDMNGYIGSSNVGYDGTHGGFGYGSRKEYMEKLMNEENEWDHKISAAVKEGPADCIRIAEVRAVLKTKRHNAPGLSGLVAEMIQATGDIGIQWLLDVCNCMYCERRMHSRGLDIKCGTANLQKQR